MTEVPNADWLFVIDTADYAGNFERELCAYITGRVGECGVGIEMHERFTEETGLEPFENVMEEADDHGCHRPATIYSTTGRDHPYNSVAISFETKPTKAQITLMMARAAAFAALPDEQCEDSPRISQILGFRLIRQTVTRTLDTETL
jgi:hypothetical protein